MREHSLQWTDGNERRLGSRTSWRDSNSAPSITFAMVLLAAVVVYGLLSTVSEVRDDESIFADPVVSILRGEGLSSVALTGVVPGAEIALSWQPPGYFYVLAAWSHLFGSTLLSGRFFSVLCMSIALAALAAWSSERDGRRFALVAVTIVGCTPWVEQAATTIRPEAANGLLLVLVFLLLNSRQGALWSRVLFAALCSGMAVLIHPLGAITPLAGCLYLLWKRRWVKVLAFAVMVIVVTFAAWVPFVMAHLDQFVEQMRLQQERKGAPNPFSLLTSRRRLLGYFSLVLSLVFLSVCRKNHLIESKVWIFLACAILGATLGGEEQYPVYILLLSVPVVASASKVLATSRGSARVGVVLAIVFCLGSAPTIYFLNDGLRLREDVSAAVSALPPNARIFLGPGAAGIYFEVPRERVRVFSPVPVASGAIDRVAREQGIVVADFARTRGSIFDSFETCARQSFGELRVVYLDRCSSRP